jgi:hypothetical protein
MGLIPREVKFFDLLEQQSNTVVKGAKLLQECLESKGSMDDMYLASKRIHDAEHEGDELVHRLMDRLNKSFITPLDREDIRTIATDLDDILDYMEGVAQYLILFEIKDSPEPLRKFAEILVAMVEEVHKATGWVWDLANEKQIYACIVRISELENQGDALYSTVIADLFKPDGRNPIEVLKWKEIYDGLEEACDGCKDYTHVLGNVVIKNA